MRHAWIAAWLLVACAPPMPWEKPGASDAMVQDDSMTCRVQARAAAVRQESGEEQREAYYTTAFRQCMLDKGYSAKR